MAEAGPIPEPVDETDGTAYRAVHPDHWKRDEEKVSSAAVPKGKPMFSVSLQRLLAQDDREADRMIAELVDAGEFAGSPAHAISRIAVPEAAAKGFRTRAERDAEAGEHASHAHIRPDSGKLTKSLQKQMAAIMSQNMLRRPPAPAA